MHIVLVVAVAWAVLSVLSVLLDLLLGAVISHADSRERTGAARRVASPRVREPAPAGVATRG